MTNKLWGVIFIIITAIIWGMSFLSIKVVIDIISPMTLALIRFVIASIILTVVVRLKNRNSKVEKEDTPKIALAGFLGVTLYFYFENNGIKMIPASAAAIIVAAAPIFSLIGEAIVFKTKLTTKKIISVIISFIGVYFIVGFSLKNPSGSGSMLGYIMMLGAVISWVIFSIITKPLFKKYSQLTIIYYQTLFGTLFLIPFGLFGSISWTQVDNVVIFNVLFLGCFCSAIGYYLYAYALDSLGVTITSIFMNLIPVIAIIASFFLLNERIGLEQIVGGALVIFSVFMANMEKKIPIEDINNQEKTAIGVRK